MSFDWEDPDKRRRLLLDLRVQVDDLDAVIDDMLSRPRRRELGPATHKSRCEELLKGIFRIIDYALATSGGAAPGSEPEGGAPTEH